MAALALTVALVLGPGCTDVMSEFRDGSLSQGASSVEEFPEAEDAPWVLGHKHYEKILAAYTNYHLRIIFTVLP